MNKTVTSGNTYSATELAAMRLPKFPTTRKSWYQIFEREKWEFVEVPGKGPGGLQRKYKPSPEVLALIEQYQRGELSPTPAPVKANPAREVQYQTMQASDGSMLMAQAKDSSPFDARRDLLEAVLRVGEYKILHDQVTKHVVEFGLEGAPTWLEAARDFPDLDLRLRNMIATFKFLKAADLS